MGSPEQCIGFEHLDERRASPQLCEPPLTLRWGEHTPLLTHRRERLTLLLAQRLHVAIHQEESAATSVHVDFVAAD